MKRVGALGRAQNLSNSRRARERRASLNRRYCDIELQALALTRQGEANRVQQRLPLLPRPLANARHGCPESVTIDQRPRRSQIVRERGYQDRKSTRLNSSHVSESRMPSSA